MLFREVQKSQQNMLSRSFRRWRKLRVDFQIAKVYFTWQFVKFWCNHIGNKVTVNQSNVLVYVNRAHRPPDQHWFFYERFSRDMKINGRVKINKPLTGLLVCRLIMSLAERLSSKFHICPRSFASRSNIHFSDIISQPRILSADIPAAWSGLFTK